MMLEVLCHQNLTQFRAGYAGVQRSRVENVVSASSSLADAISCLLHHLADDYQIICWKKSEFIASRSERKTPG